MLFISTRQPSSSVTITEYNPGPNPIKSSSVLVKSFDPVQEKEYSQVHPQLLGPIVPLLTVTRYFITTCI